MLGNFFLCIPRSLCKTYNFKRLSKQACSVASARAIHSFTSFLIHDILSLLWLPHFSDDIHHILTYLNILWWHAYDIRGWLKHVHRAASARAILSFTRVIIHEILSFLWLSHFSDTVHQIFTFEGTYLNILQWWHTYNIRGWSQHVHRAASARAIGFFTRVIIHEFLVPGCLLALENIENPPWATSDHSGRRLSFLNIKLSCVHALLDSWIMNSWNPQAIWIDQLEASRRPLSCFNIWPRLLAGAWRYFFCRHWLDNTAVLSSCVHGYSRNTDLAAMSNLLHLALAQLQNTSWFEFANLARNIADLPTRPQDGE